MKSEKFAPDLSRDAVFKPCSRMPFEFYSEVSELDLCMEDKFHQAWWAINLCHASYCSRDKLFSLLKDKVELFEVFRERTQLAYVVKVRDLFFLIFQGSSSPEDTVLDLNFFPEKEESMVMHRGFKKAFSYIWPQVEKFLDSIKNKNLIIAGHSLGGALAYIASTKITFKSLFTFGAPRVLFGSKKKICEDNIYRFVNCSDAVPTLPPGIFGFKHIGKMYFIDQNQEIHDGSGRKFVMDKLVSSSNFLVKGKGLIKGNAPLRSLADHAPLNYSRALSRHLLTKELEN